MDDDERQPDPPAPRLPPIRWARRVALPVVAGLVGAALLIPVDWTVRRSIQWFEFPGDVERSIEMLQEFGNATVIMVVGAVILLLDRERFRRMLDWILAATLAGALVKTLKVLTGRHRPDVGLETVWIGPLGEYDFEGDGTRRMPIEFWADGVFENLSMPSGHTMQATIAACFLAHMYPALRPLVWTLVGITALTRVYVGAHWLSDTVLSVGLGLACAHLMIERYWGVRLLDWIWVRVVDRSAEPAFPETYRRDRRWRA